jgi:hypothetical protein
LPDQLDRSNSPPAMFEFAARHVQPMIVHELAIAPA